MTQEELATERLYASRLDWRDRRWLEHITGLERQLKEAQVELAQARAADAGVQHLMDQVRSCASFADAVCALRDGYDLNLVMRSWYRDARLSTRVTVWPCVDGALNGRAQVELVGRDIRVCANEHPAAAGKFCKKCGAPVERRQEPVRWRVTQLPGYGEPSLDYHPARIPADAPVSERREVVEAWVDAGLVSTHGAALAGGPVVP